ncbi:hypothetical protein ALQ55_200244 [Pseudomonas savastanoi pv. savastanoi]|nr:hypothetical protein ALQ55_200244 [Pseudomonas savastanoi pv. savastanoi]
MGIDHDQTQLDVPTLQDDRAGVPRVVVQVAITILTQDVVDPNRPGKPAMFGLLPDAIIALEQPPAAHVAFLAIGRGDVLIRRTLGASNDPGGDAWTRNDHRKSSPKSLFHGGSDQQS